VLDDSNRQPVTASRQVFNALVAVKPLPEESAERRNVVMNIAILYDAIRPHLLHEVFLKHNLASPFDEGSEHAGRCGGERHRLALALNHTGLGIKTERPELIEMLLSLGHVSPLLEFCEKPSKGKSAIF
jgi:hypothetical protein